MVFGWRLPFSSSLSLSSFSGIRMTATLFSSATWNTVAVARRRIAQGWRNRALKAENAAQEAMSELTHLSLDMGVKNLTPEQIVVRLDVIYQQLAASRSAMESK
jgi:hypothetical protein